MSSFYVKEGQHVPDEAKDKFNGSLRFCSRIAHKNSKLSRRDDLESLLYVLVFLCKGELPWMKLQANNFIDANHEVHDCKVKKRDELLAGMP